MIYVVTESESFNTNLKFASFSGNWNTGDQAAEKWKRKEWLVTEVNISSYPATEVAG